MKAVILAAGKGSRMGDLTKDVPKPLLKVGNKTLLGNILDTLPHEVNEIIIVIGHKGEKIIEQFGDNYLGKKIYYIKQDIIDGTAGAVLLTKEFFTQKKERFMIIYGDEYPTVNQVKECVSREFSWLCREMKDPTQSGVPTISEDRRIIDVIEKPKNPKSNFVVSGVMVVNTDIFNCKPEKHETGEYVLTDMMNNFIKDHSVYAVEGIKDVSFSYAEDIDNFNNRSAKGCSITVRKILHDDKWVQADIIDVDFPNDKKISNFLRLKIKNNGSVSVCARMNDGRFILTRQLRPVAGLSIESVAGGGEKGKSWDKLAVKEMIQETGYSPGKLVRVGNFYTQGDRMDNKHHLFLAFDCIKSEKKLPKDEVQDIECIIRTPQEVLDMIKTGEINDMPTIAGIFAHLCYENNLEGIKGAFHETEVPNI